MPLRIIRRLKVKNREHVNKNARAGNQAPEPVTHDYIRTQADLHTLNRPLEITLNRSSYPPQFWFCLDQLTPTISNTALQNRILIRPQKRGRMNSTKCNTLLLGYTGCAFYLSTCQHTLEKYRYKTKIIVRWKSPSSKMVFITTANKKSQHTRLEISFT
jgi:hypothetical protein